MLNPAQHPAQQAAMLQQPHLGAHSPPQLPGALHEVFDPLNPAPAAQEDPPPQGMGLPVVMHGPHLGPAPGAPVAAALQPPNNNPPAPAANAGGEVPAGQAHQGGLQGLGRGGSPQSPARGASPSHGRGSSP